MKFTRNTADLTPIVDTVFAIVEKAKQDKQQHGADNVIDATIGTLHDENGQLVAFDSVFTHFDQIDHQTKAAYASSFTGNPSYRKAVYDWLLQGRSLSLAHSVIATPGGSGAISSAFTTFLDQGQTVILPNIAWGSYTLMAKENNLNFVQYELFEDDHFHLASLRQTMEQVSQKQDRLVVVINDPCHNPTGYSLSISEWQQVMEICKTFSSKMPVILINDIAYIDYSYTLDHVRDYLEVFQQMDDHMMVCIGFSSSKTLTSYGLRCGAAIILAKNQDDVRQAEIILEKKARATWSNIPNAAMDNFTWVTTENKQAFLSEKQYYIDLLQKRSQLFLSQANQCGLPTYPYKEGFFVTIKCFDQSLRNRYHQALMDQHIYTVCCAFGIRVAICSLPLKHVNGLAQKMKEILDDVERR